MSADATNPHNYEGPRSLVLFLDGTANEYNASNTNVVKLLQLLDKNAPQQLTYYQPGIGTYAVNVNPLSRVTAWFAKTIDLGVAWYFGQHVTSAYQFIMDNWRERGQDCIVWVQPRRLHHVAARALAGMLEKIGLLPRGNIDELQLAFKLYARQDAESVRLASNYKAQWCRQVSVEFVGVWDTVSSVGAIVSRHFPYAGHADTIKNFRHAISLDEHRARFRQNRWQAPHFLRQGPENPGYTEDQDYDSSSPTPALVLQSQSNTNNGHVVASAATNVEEVYFAGTHCGVGGSDYKDAESLQLSNITLHWMIRKIEQNGNTGIVFAQDRLATFITDFENQATSENGIHYNRNSSAAIIDRLLDPKRPFVSAAWWLLEIFPFPLRKRNYRQNKWSTTFVPHFARPRQVSAGSRVHYSVQHKQALFGYSTRAKFLGEVQYVSTEDIV